MEKKRQGWRRLRNVKLDRKKLARHARRLEGASQRHARRFIIRRIDNMRIVSREVTIWLMLVSMIFAGMGLQFMWGQHNYSTEASAAGGLYAEGALGRVSTLNPLFVTSEAESSVARLVFSSLYVYDETGSLHPDLATGMTVDPTGKVYTVHMRSDAKWHDGKSVSAQDVVFTINMIKNPATRSSLRVNWLDVAVSAVDASTLQFTLPATYAPFPHALTFPVLPEHLLENVAAGVLRESAFSQSPVGSGPFEFKLLQQVDATGSQKVVHLTANQQYYAGAPKLTRFELHTYATEDQLLRALQAGELSGATDISVTSLASVPSARYTTTPQVLDSGVYLLFNMNNTFLKDSAVRRALQLTTDAGKIRELLGGGVGRLDGPLLDGQVTGSDVPHAPAVDIKKAEQILDEAGWKMTGSYRVKDNVKLQLTITTTSDKEYEKVVAEVEKQWKPLGINVTHKIIDMSTSSSSFVQDTLQSRNFDVLLYKLSIGADPDVYAYWHSSQTGVSGYNFSGYSNKVVDASLSSARARLEPDLRNAKYKQFVRQWIEDVPAIALYQPVVSYAANKNIHAISSGNHLVTGADRYATVQYWSVADETVYRTP